MLIQTFKIQIENDRIALQNTNQVRENPNDTVAIDKLESCLLLENRLHSEDRIELAEAYVLTENPKRPLK